MDEVSVEFNEPTLELLDRNAAAEHEGDKPAAIRELLGEWLHDD
jgi:hypothetical protein